MDPQKWSREPKKALKEKELAQDFSAFHLPEHLPGELEQSRFWFRRTKMRLRLFLTGSIVTPVLLGTDEQ